MFSKKPIYLDNASTTSLSEGVKKVITKHLNDYANPNSRHDMGETARQKMIEDKMAISYRLFGTHFKHTIFTSSGSEANTMAIIGLEKYLKRKGKSKIITSKYEHSSVLNAMKEMERRGFRVKYLNVKDGSVDTTDLENAIDENTGLVSIMYVNNEVGTSNNVAKISEICRNNDILFHTDCVQAASDHNISPEVIGADLISISGHKIHAPKGIGVLYANNPQLLSPIIFGGQQERGLRGGTENTLYIKALSQAVRERMKFSGEDTYKQLYSYLTEFLTKNVTGVNFNAPLLPSKRILSVRFDGVDAETLVLLLSNEGVMVSAGSACDSHSSKPSHTLLAIGLTEKQARETIRISFSEYNTMKEIKYAAIKIKQCVESIRSLSNRRI